MPETPNVITSKGAQKPQRHRTGAGVIPWNLGDVTQSAGSHSEVFVEDQYGPAGHTPPFHIVNKGHQLKSVPPTATL